jgi:hypothetical protein
MGMTPYTGSTTVITNIGTNPEERGLTTDEFKSKFDEGLTAFVAWFNATHLGETKKIKFKATDDFTTSDLADGEIGFVYTP